MSYNTVLIIGNLGAEPESRHFESGAQVTTMNVAVYDGKDKPSIWVKVKCWNEVAQALPPQLGKGDRVQVVGRLSQPEAWLSKADNQPKCSLVLSADSVALKPWKDDARGSDNQAPQQQQPAQTESTQSAAVPDFDGIPF